MEVKLRHHVFSSEGGYKTMHVSPELRPLLGMLEGFAKRIYKKVKREALYAVLSLDGGNFALSKTFVAGSDHVGRFRSCVHTVVPDDEPFQSTPFLNPFDLMGKLPFLGEGLNLLAVAGELEPAAEFTPQTGIVIPKPQVTEELARAVFMGMLSPHHEAVASDPTGAVKELVAAFYALLPAFVRSDFSSLFGAYLPPAEDRIRIDFFVLPGGADLKEFKASGKLIIDVGAGKLENVPGSSPYCDMVMDACFGRSDGSALKRFLWLMQKHDFSGEPTWDVVQSLVEAFSLVEKLTSEDGKIDVSAEPRAALKAVVPFARGGYPELALVLLRDVAGQAISKSETGMVARDLVQLVKAIEAGMEELKKRPAVLFQRLSQLSDALLKFFAQSRRIQKPKKDTGTQDKITDTMLSWDL